MATNEILRFAETDTGTNLLTQAEYLADSQRPIGNQPGVARSKLVNKALRQASLIAAGLAEYIADNQANNITDALTPQNIADYLQAALTGALGVTPPQFDNDTSLATTAFVQRALGNLRSETAVNSSTTLGAAAIGQLVVGGAGTYTTTLPLANSVPVGAQIHFFGTADIVTWVVQRQGADIIDNNGGGTFFTVGTGDSAVLESNGVGTWRIVSGSVSLRNSRDFGKSLASNGYQRLPSGLIIQWAGGTSQAASGNQVITLPIAFPNAPLRCQVTNLYGSAAQNGGYGVITATATSVTVARNNADNGNGVTPQIIAFGY